MSVAIKDSTVGSKKNRYRNKPRNAGLYDRPGLDVLFGCRARSLGSPIQAIASDLEEPRLR